MSAIITLQTASRIYNSANAKKGHDFEDYIITLFNAKKFKLLEWRNSKQASNGAFPLNNSYPDLEFIFVGKKKYKFAVECKWRDKFQDGKIEWATKNKIKIYIQYQKQQRIPVFIAIGVGGKPSNPQKLFVTPIDIICKSCDVYEHELIEYSRKPTRRFFYNTVQPKLF